MITLSMKLERQIMAEIYLSNRPFNVFADKRARDAMKRHKLNPKDLLAPLVDAKFEEPEKCRSVFIEVKINDNVKGNFIIQPTLVYTQKWFIMTYTNLAAKPVQISESKFRIDLTCGHSIINDVTVGSMGDVRYFECQVCKRKK